ncbi:hypothetical protein LTS16_025671 [Friedmanniomyces endolithicus]|nr:hypothetical protein LTR57_024585 [Friedmanniomyces endolithicus]KAK0959684.1 hypothetical protein LTS01_021289 [Friedmanniomyces endolithicus]KAK1022489.1 hypothetical protein LTS16_025671 [Friedmanniomyces endolithicus]
MVTRKPVGPPLSTSAADDPNATATANPPYPTTPPTATLPHSIPGTDRDRADPLHSAGSIYSPDLRSSPAFDLIDVNEARQRPRRDSDVSSHGTWDSEDDGERGDTPEEEAALSVPKPLRISKSQQNLGPPRELQPRPAMAEEELPGVLRPGPAGAVGVQPRKSEEGQRYEEEALGNPWASSTAAETGASTSGQPVSNNPYRQQNGWTPETGRNARQNVQPPPPTSAPPAPPVEMPTAPRTPADELSKLSLGEHPQQRPTAKAFETADILSVPQQGGMSLSDFDEPAHLHGQQSPPGNPCQTSSHERAPQERNTSPRPPPALKAPASSHVPPPGPPPKGIASTSLIESDDPPSHQASSVPMRPIAHLPSRSADVAPETPGTHAHRQRSEHYQIKHVNWLDSSVRSMRRSPILTQNANGPCPLLALVNALILTTPQGLDTPLVETLRSREQVSLGLLLDAVFDELMSGRRGDTASELPDVGELYTFLLALHTGMNVNPRFVAPVSAPRGSLEIAPPGQAALHPTKRAPLVVGCFEETKEMRLYSTLNVPLIHGWTAPHGTEAYAAFERSAQTFEEAQNMQFLQPELERVSREAGLTAAEQQTLHDIRTIRTFLTTWSTQLTDYGLEAISASLQPGQTAILFRNDHFSTIYREPRHGALMTLVTDAGYESHDEIVWESLVDVNGAASEMFSGDFRAVSHGQDAGLTPGGSAGGDEGWETVRARMGGQTRSNVDERSPGPPLPGPRPQQSATALANSAHPYVSSAQAPAQQRSASEQQDHDLALALQLQEEEEDQQRQSEQRRRREQELSERFLSTENSPTEGARPPIPPRRSGNTSNIPIGRSTAAPSHGRPTVNRPTTAGDGGDPDAPPSYEQSRSDRPYRPASAGAQQVSRQGNPPRAYDTLLGQQGGSRTNINAAGAGVPGVGLGRRQTRASSGDQSGPGRMSSQMSGPAGPSAGPGSGRVMPGTYGSGMLSGPTPASPGLSMGTRPNQQAAGVRDAEEKCAVM